MKSLTLFSLLMLPLVLFAHHGQPQDLHDLDQEQHEIKHELIKPAV